MGHRRNASIEAIEESERDILRRIDRRLERTDRRIGEGADYLTELRTEVEITRISYEHQLELTRVPPRPAAPPPPDLREVSGPRSDYGFSSEATVE